MKKIRNDRRDGFVLNLIMTFTLILISMLIGISTGCGGGGSNGVIPTIAPPTANVTLPPNPQTISVNFVTSRANGKIEVNQLTGLGTLAITTVNLNSAGNGVALLAKNADFNGLLYDAADLNNSVFSKNFSTGANATSITFDESQPPDPTPTPTNTPDPSIPTATPTNTPDPANPTPTNTPIPGSTPTFTPIPVDPPNPGTPVDFITTAYDIEAFDYNADNLHFYIALSNATIAQYTQSGSYVNSSTSWGGGAVPPAFSGVAYNAVTSEIGALDAKGRIMIYDTNLTYKKRGLVPVNCTDLIVNQGGDWVIANSDGSRIETYSNTFTDGTALTLNNTIGVGILSIPLGIKINNFSQYLSTNSGSDKIIIINANNTLASEINLYLPTDLDNFDQYIFASHGVQGYLSIFNQSDGGTYMSQISGVVAGLVVIVDRNLYFTSSDKKIRSLPF